MGLLVMFTRGRSAVKGTHRSLHFMVRESPFKRCLICDGELETVENETVQKEVLRQTAKYF